MLAPQLSKKTEAMDSNPPISQYELLKIIFDFIGTIFWPLITFIIVLIYRKAILRLIDRAKKIELPGGLSLEAIEEDIKEAKELAIEIKIERKPEVQNLLDTQSIRLESEANKKMIDNGLRPSPSGLDLSYYKDIANTDPRLALVGLRIDFELMLRNLAKGFKIRLEEKEPLSKVISKMLNFGAITTKQYEFINVIFRISNSAAHGSEISRRQVYEVLEIGQVLVDDYLAWLDWGFKKQI
ncbi:DUF4145 domain-containing protein [Pedobacter jejuensis]|uniref:DUF4145 domain-containing protein n=1 Tax=Pedobacter jejuensis TaxID=1268550 RepID=A0A3N0BUD0_9SPHI|nr:DUF4145 domain-containing protein [Pedobacter jejuensis]RNL52490.1 DUF4145 domain-containing protein [Pedobacter jejuensis]